MAIGYGLGIGLQGKPKDYVDLAKSREAAKQKYQADKIKKQGDDVNEAMKSFAAKAPVESVLPANQRAKEEAIARFYKTAMDNVGVDTPNMMQVYQSATQTLSELNDYNEQFKIFKQLEQNPGNYGLFQSDIDAVSKTNDPIELQKKLREGVGGLDFDPQTGFLSVKKIGKFQPASTQLNDFVTKYKDFIFYDREQGTPQKFKINNTTVEYFGMDEGSKNMFLNAALAGDNYESNRREFRANQITQGIVPPAQFSPEETEAVKGYVSSLYDQAAMTLLSDRNFNQQKGINITVNTGDEKSQDPGRPDLNPRQNTIYAENPAYSSNGGTTYTALMTFQLPKATVLTSVPSYARNTNTGKKITESQGEFTNGSIQQVALTTKAVTLRSRLTGKDIQLEAGTLITDDLLLEAALNGIDYEYTTAAFGAFKATGEDSAVPTYFKSKDTENAVYFESMAKDKVEAFKKGLLIMQRGSEKFKNLPKDQKAKLISEYGNNVKPMFQKLGEGESNPQSTISAGKVYSFDQLKSMGANIGRDYKKTKDGNYIKK
jgi:hypothetical protein